MTLTTPQILIPTPNPIAINEKYSSTWLRHAGPLLVVMPSIVNKSVLIPCIVFLLFPWLHWNCNGEPNKNLFISNEFTTKVSNCVHFEILQQSLFCEMFRDANLVNLEISCGITPLKLFMEKSNWSNIDMLLREVGICPSIWFIDKFNNLKLFRVPIL